MTISTSPNISNFDFEVLFDISVPVPIATMTDISTYIGGGASNIIGINFTMIDPSNLTFHQTVYPPNVDLYPGGTTFQKNLPFFNNTVKWGNYRVYATLIDADGTQYVWTDTNGLTYKTINLCKPNSLQGATGSYGGLNLLTDFNCDVANLLVQDGGTGFVYNGISPSETTTNLVISYPADPTGTITTVVATFIPFTLPITLQGSYTIQGTVIQTYQLTPTTSVKAAYYYNQTTNVQCGFTLCQALCEYEQLLADVQACNFSSPAETAKKQRELILITGLLTQVIAFKNCGKKFDNILTDIQRIGNFKCDCNCAPVGIAPAPVFFGGTLVKGTMCGDINLTFTQFGNNVRVDASDVTYVVQPSVGSAPYMTITPVIGECSKTYVIDVDFAAAIAATVTICIENTAFVTPCGNDETGTIGNFLLPFQTIKAAVSATTSNAGQTVWVWTGTYYESIINKGDDNIEKTGLSYYFSPGATVNGGSEKVFAISLASEIIVRGAGFFTASVSGAVVNLNSTDAILDIQCLDISNTGLSVSNGVGVQAGTLVLKCHSIKTTGNSCIDVRTGITTGYIEVDLLDNQNAALSAPAFKVSSTGVHLWDCYVKETNTKSNAGGNSAGVFVISSGAVIQWHGNVHQNLDSGGSRYLSAIMVNGGQLIFDGQIDTVTGYGATCISGSLIINGGRIRAGGDWSAIKGEEPSGASLIVVQGVMASNNSETAATVSYAASNVGSIELDSCKIKNSNTVAGNKIVELTGTTQEFIANNCVFMSGGAGNTIYTAVNIDTRLINCWSNVGNGGAGVQTDLIQPLNVDASVKIYVY